MKYPAFCLRELRAFVVKEPFLLVPSQISMAVGYTRNGRFTPLARSAAAQSSPLVVTATPPPSSRDSVSATASSRCGPPRMLLELWPTTTADRHIGANCRQPRTRSSSNSTPPRSSRQATSTPPSPRPARPVAGAPDHQHSAGRDGNRGDGQIRRTGRAPPGGQSGQPAAGACGVASGGNRDIGEEKRSWRWLDRRDVARLKDIATSIAGGRAWT